MLFKDGLEEFGEIPDGTGADWDGKPEIELSPGFEAIGVEALLSNDGCCCSLMAASSSSPAVPVSTASVMTTVDASALVSTCGNVGCLRPK